MKPWEIGLARSSGEVDLVDRSLELRHALPILGNLVSRLRSLERDSVEEVGQSEVEQGIATVNELAAPVDRPIAFKITATSVMNAFFVPSLAGMVYAMPGMETTLHAVINRPGVYDGFSSNYSGEGFSHMRFKFHGLPNDEFDRWVQQVKASGETKRGEESHHRLLRRGQ